MGYLHEKILFSCIKELRHVVEALGESNLLEYPDQPLLLKVVA